MRNLGGEGFELGLCFGSGQVVDGLLDLFAFGAGGAHRFFTTET
jgi:hypothetical protein